MTEKATLEAALGRLGRALDSLEAAVNRRLDSDQKLSSLEDELQRLGEDRSRLAQSLDDAEARSNRLEDANREVSERLVAAMESIRGVLDTNGTGQPR